MREGGRVYVRECVRERYCEKEGVLERASVCEKEGESVSMCVSVHERQTAVVVTSDVEAVRRRISCGFILYSFLLIVKFSIFLLYISKINDISILNGCICIFVGMTFKQRCFLNSVQPEVQDTC